MEPKDLIPILCVLLMVGLTFRVNHRMEHMKNSFQRTLKRYDQLNAERFKQLDLVDDRMVDVQMFMHEAYISIARSTLSVGAPQLLAFKNATSALAVAKIKSEKYFEPDFNERFRKLVGDLQNVLMHATDLNSEYMSAEQKHDKFGELNEAMLDARRTVPEFRKLMALRIQENLD